MDLLIRGGRVVDPSQGLDAVADVGIKDGKIACLGDAPPNAARLIDARGLIVAPGLIDMHVHLREPGDEEEETIASGTAAALAGGFTTVLAMPNTDPVIDNEAAVEFVLRQARRAAHAFVFPAGAITKGQEGKELAEMGQMVRGGALAFTDDGRSVASSAVMLRAMQYVTMLDRPILQHCQDPDLGTGIMHAGLVSTVLGMPGSPSLAEELILARDLALAESTGARYHAMHLSSARSVELIRRAKAARLPVSCEVTTHHVALTDEYVRTSQFDPNFKMSPPLRTAADRDALRQGLADGTIDALVSDHAPHTCSEKELEFAEAPFGVIGLESALAVNVRELVATGVLTWPQLIEKMAVRPAQLLRLSKGTLAIGADADVTLIAPERPWRIDPEAFRSKSRNCPFAGWDVQAKAVGTIVLGRLRYDDGLPVTP